MNATVKWHGQVVYEGPVIPGTPADPTWWTWRRRLSTKFTAAGWLCTEQAVTQLLWLVDHRKRMDALADDPRYGHVTGVVAGEITGAVDGSITTVTGADFSAVWDAVADDVRQSIAREALRREQE